MKKLAKLLKGHKTVVFLDFEATQFSHEMIAIGAVVATLDNQLRIKKSKPPFKIYVKAKNKIGKYVSSLTGISESLLLEQGVDFAEALKELKKYVGINFKKCSFITFSKNDIHILGQSIAYNLNAPKEISSQIIKNHIDYAVFINEFVRDEKGNPQSLSENCETFGVKLVGTLHDPSDDAVNLMLLWDAFLKQPKLVEERYKKTLSFTNHLPQPIFNAVKKLSLGMNVTNEDFESFIHDYIK